MTDNGEMSGAQWGRQARLLTLGAVCGVAGLLPWFLQGAQLPLQNLWVDQSMSDDMPLVLLPFSQYYLGFLAGVMVIPWLLVGFMARGPLLAGTHHRLVALAMGIGAVQLVALAQTSIVVGTGLDFDGGRSLFAVLYLLGMVGGCLVAAGLGVVVFLLLARAPRSDAVLGLGMAAVVVAPWTREFLFAGEFAPVYWDWGYVLGRWLAAAYLGLMIGWNGVWPAKRLLTSAAALAIWWIGSAVLWGLQFMVGSRSSLGRPTEMANGFISGFTITLRGVHPSSIIVAMLVAVVTLWIRRIRSSDPSRYVGASG